MVAQLILVQLVGVQIPAGLPISYDQEKRIFDGRLT